jgi:hypothetical protein
MTTEIGKHTSTGDTERRPGVNRRHLIKLAGVGAGGLGVAYVTACASQAEQSARALD